MEDADYQRLGCNIAQDQASTVASRFSPVSPVQCSALSEATGTRNSPQMAVSPIIQSSGTSRKSTNFYCMQCRSQINTVSRKFTFMCWLHINTILLRFDCDSTAVRLQFDRALQPFDDLRRMLTCLFFSAVVEWSADSRT